MSTTTESAAGREAVPELAATATRGVGDTPRSGQLDVRAVPAVRRRALILERFEQLAPRETFVVVNDHDPKPVYYQLFYEYSGRFAWAYEEQGPEVWRVRIGKLRAINGNGR